MNLNLFIRNNKFNKNIFYNYYLLGNLFLNKNKILFLSLRNLYKSLFLNYYYYYFNNFNFILFNNNTFIKNSFNKFYILNNIISFNLFSNLKIFVNNLNLDKKLLSKIIFILKLKKNLKYFKTIFSKFQINNLNIIKQRKKKKLVKKFFLKFLKKRKKKKKKNLKKKLYKILKKKKKKKKFNKFFFIPFFLRNFYFKYKNYNFKTLKLGWKNFRKRFKIYYIKCLKDTLYSIINNNFLINPNIRRVYWYNVKTIVFPYNYYGELKFFFKQKKYNLAIFLKRKLGKLFINKKIIKKFKLLLKFNVLYKKIFSEAFYTEFQSEKRFGLDPFFRKIKYKIRKILKKKKKLYFKQFFNRKNKYIKYFIFYYYTFIYLKYLLNLKINYYLKSIYIYKNKYLNIFIMILKFFVLNININIKCLINIFIEIMDSLKTVFILKNINNIFNYKFKNIYKNFFNNYIPLNILNINLLNNIVKNSFFFKFDLYLNKINNKIFKKRNFLKILYNKMSIDVRDNFNIYESKNEYFLRYKILKKNNNMFININNKLINIKNNLIRKKIILLFKFNSIKNKWKFIFNKNVFKLFKNKKKKNLYNLYIKITPKNFYFNFMYANKILFYINQGMIKMSKKINLKKKSFRYKTLLFKKLLTKFKIFLLKKKIKIFNIYIIGKFNKVLRNMLVHLYYSLKYRKKTNKKTLFKKIRINQIFDYRKRYHSYPLRFKKKRRI